MSVFRLRPYCDAGEQGSRNVRQVDEGSATKGASLVEYSLLVLLIAIAALAAVAYFGDELSSTYSDISSNLVDAGS